MQANDSKKMTVAIYARVSKGMQDYEMQLTELRSYAGRAGWEATEYLEKASSVKRRPVFDRMLADAKLRKFEGVLVWKLDRFARSISQLVEHVSLFDSLGIRFVCVTQGIDTNMQNAGGRMFMQILGVFAEFERNLIVERVRAGVAEAKRRGVHCGRKPRIFRRDEAMRLRGLGMSFRKIAAEMGLPTQTVVDGIKLYGKPPYDAKGLRAET
jgi:DNA invertase Pin-like site-specific DNA recombinase